MSETDTFGEQIPFCEPYWYQGYPSPYYNDDHKVFRAKCRKFVEEELKPYAEEWIKKGSYPLELHQKAYEKGLNGLFFPKEFGGHRPDDYDPFYELILVDELARLGSGGVLGQAAINAIALPPILIAGSDYIKQKVCRDIITGKKQLCLAISEPDAGSDVANIQTTAKKDGDNYIVNGNKKWITGGLYADYFTTLVRTGDDGPAGLSLLLIERNSPGISIRKMEPQFDTCHGITFITFDDVKVPTKHLIGSEGMGFMLILLNFNHERLSMIATSCRYSRLCYEEAIKYSLTRETFGKKLCQHQLVRYKLAEMARQIEALHDNTERLFYEIKKGVPDLKLGAQTALLKVQASKTFEFCAREASQIFGGSSLVKEGKGKIVERLYREVRAMAIPGGSEEIMLDFAMRQVTNRELRKRKNAAKL